MTKTDVYLRHAILLGWRVTDDGAIYNSKGNRVKIQMRGKFTDPVRKRYPRVAISKNDIQFPIEVHKLAALYFFGEEYWNNKSKGWQVRHLDGNVLNLSKANITMGTCSENNMDKPKLVRQKSARASMASSNSIFINCPVCNKTVPKLTFFRWHADHAGLSSKKS